MAAMLWGAPSSNAAAGGLTYQRCITGEKESGLARSGACAAIASASPSGESSGLDGVTSVEVSADGTSLYAASFDDAAVAQFDRDPTTGVLTYSGCITGDSESGPAGSGACAAIPSASPDGANSGLGFLLSLTLSADGRSLYASGGASVAQFQRDPATGALDYRGCITGAKQTGPAGSGACARIPTATTAGENSGLSCPYSLTLSADGTSLYASAGLRLPSALAVSDDGSALYATSELDDAVAAFALNGTIGALRYRGCVTGERQSGPAGTGACEAIPSARSDGSDSGMDNEFRSPLALSGNSLYTGSMLDDAIARFRR